MSSHALVDESKRYSLLVATAVEGGDCADDGSSGSTLGTPGKNLSEAPPSDDESFVVSGGGLANGTEDEGGSGNASKD